LYLSRRRICDPPRWFGRGSIEVARKQRYTGGRTAVSVPGPRLPTCAVHQSGQLSEVTAAIAVVEQKPTRRAVWGKPSVAAEAIWPGWKPIPAQVIRDRRHQVLEIRAQPALDTRSSHFDKPYPCTSPHWIDRIRRGVQRFVIFQPGVSPRYNATPSEVRKSLT
jgi:hypothetical protein